MDCLTPSHKDADTLSYSPSARRLPINHFQDTFDEGSLAEVDRSSGARKLGARRFSAARHSEERGGSRAVSAADKRQSGDLLLLSHVLLMPRVHAGMLPTAGS
jgi:hypothetical protein